MGVAVACGRGHSGRLSSRAQPRGLVRAQNGVPRSPQKGCLQMTCGRGTCPLHTVKEHVAPVRERKVSRTGETPQSTHL